jgi:hypothetical protein
MSREGPIPDILYRAALWPIGPSSQGLAVADPGTLESLAHQHRISYVLGQWLAAGNIALPVPLAQNIRRDTMRAMSHAAMLAKLLPVLLADGVPALVLKGLPLAARLYRNGAARGVGDIDLLIDPAHLENAHAVLLRQGFSPLFRVAPTELRPLVKDALYRSNDGTLVELHWRLSANRHVLSWRFADLWQERDRVEVFGITLPALPPVHLTVYLAVHGLHHGWERLRWLADIALRLNNPDHCREALDLADAAGVGAALRQAWWQVATCWGNNWPGPRAPEPTGRTRWLCLLVRWHSLWRHRPGLSAWLYLRVIETLLDLLVACGWRVTLEAVRLLFASQSDHEETRVPDWCRPMLRPFLLLRRIIRPGHVSRRDR